MRLREFVLNACLSLQQPVHRVVEFMHIDFAKLQFLGQCVLSVIRVHACRNN